MKCKICKNKIENLNLSIFHDCKNTFPYLFDINEEKKYYCYNPFKNIHMNKFYNQIEFEKEYNNHSSIRTISSLEFEGISIIESLLCNFFNYQFNNQIDKLFFHNSSFDEEIAERLKIIIKNLHNSNLEEKIEKAIKEYILDVYYLILAKEHSIYYEISQDFLEIFTKKIKNTEKYKKEIIDYFYKYFKEKENIKNNLNKFIYIPNDIKIIDNLEQKYILMKLNNNIIPSSHTRHIGFIYQDEEIYYNNVILYSIEKNEVLSSCYVTKIIKINNNNYIGLDKNKNLIDIDIKIDPVKNMFNLEISQCFKYIELKELIDFDIIDEYRLIYIDKLNNILLLLKKNGDFFKYATINQKISKYNNEQILIDKDSGQFAILYNIEKNAILKFYDLKLNLKKNIELEDLNDYAQDFLSNDKEGNFSSIKKFNKELYIIFGKRIYLISVKYLEIISILNNIKYELNCKYFIFPNSKEIFIKYHNNDEKYLYRYKLIKNELTLFKKYIYEDELSELEEIDNKGNYSIIYQDYNLWQEYYIKNNKNENYLYPIFKEIRNKAVSRRGKRIEKYVDRSKYAWGEIPKNKARYFEKKYDDYYFKKALNQVKKKKRRQKIQEIEDKKEVEENDEEKNEKEDIIRKEEFTTKNIKEKEELNKEKDDISSKGYFKTKEKPKEEKEVKKYEDDDKLLTKIDKKEENILTVSDPGKKKRKKKKKNFKEVDDNIITHIGILEAGSKEKKRRGKTQKIFVYNEEDFPKLK